MKRTLSPLAVAVACILLAGASTSAATVSIGDIRHLSRAEIDQGRPVTLEATVTYYWPQVHDLVVQDGDAGIFIESNTIQNLQPGDRVRINGTTHWGYIANVASNDITVIRHGAMPKPVPASFEQLIQSRFDSILVTVHGVIHAADASLRSGTNKHLARLKILTDGGFVNAIVMDSDSLALDRLLDAEVELTGVAGGRFDGKRQLTGITLHVNGPTDIRMIKAAAVNPWQLPVTPMDQILRASKMKYETSRVRVEGTVTYFQPGSTIVLQDGDKSLWARTSSFGPVQVGNRAEVTGFPDVINGSLVLTGSEIRDSGVAAPVEAVRVTPQDLRNGRRDTDLVSLQGIVMMQVRETYQDEYVLLAEGQLFNAIYPHRMATDALPPMKDVPTGSTVRVTGICTKSEENPLSRDAQFNILIRSEDDIGIVASPSFWTVRNLSRILVSLLLAMLIAGAKALWTGRRMRSQVAVLGYLSQRRGEILEDINRSRPLVETLEKITELSSMTLKGAPCWCIISDGPTIGNRPSDLNAPGLRIVQVPIEAHSGQILGSTYAAFDARTKPRGEESKALDAAAALATLAIETARLHSDLVHRSEFDMLTDIKNRFAFEKRLDELITESRRNAGMFALIYIDLNDFKQVNDRYGHQAGDLYLQKVAERMKHQLRGRDLLARLGGDEFGVLVSIVHNRNEAEEITNRLEKCFDEPFTLKNQVVRGSASIGLAVYPVDGVTDDGLMSIADAAMYVKKRINKSQPDESVNEPAKRFVAW